MKIILRANSWLHAMIEKGWGNGYVIIPEGHPLHGLDYDSIPVDVHGGLTWSCSGEEFKELISAGGGTEEELTEEDLKGWVVGFDTAHYGDSMEKWPQEAVYEEAENLAKQLEEYKP